MKANWEMSREEKIAAKKEIKAYANRCGYSDVEPYEVVRVISDKTVEVRLMDAELAPGSKPEIIPGGFAGHCVNNRDLEYVIKSNPDRLTKRIRWSEAKLEWRDKSGARYSMNDKPVRYYDYNF